MSKDKNQKKDKIVYNKELLVKDETNKTKIVYNPDFITTIILTDNNKTKIEYKPELYIPKE